MSKGPALRAPWPVPGGTGQEAACGYAVAGTEIGVSGPLGAGLGLRTPKPHWPDAWPFTTLGVLPLSPYWTAGWFFRQVSDRLT